MAVTRRRFLGAGAALAAAALAPGARTRARPLDDGSRTVEALVAAHAILAAHGALPRGGHLSVRDERATGAFLLLGSLSGGRCGARDVRVHALASAGARDERAAHVHAAIYLARPDVGAIVHTTALPVIASGAAAGPGTAGAGTGGVTRGTASAPGVDILRGGVATIDASTAAAGEIARALGFRPAILLLGRGVLVVAPALPAAVFRGVYAEASLARRAPAIAPERAGPPASLARAGSAARAS